MALVAVPNSPNPGTTYVVAEAIHLWQPRSGAEDVLEDPGCQGPGELPKANDKLSKWITLNVFWHLQQ